MALYTYEGNTFESAWSPDDVYNYLRSKGVGENVARQEATVAILRYGSDLQRVLDSAIPHYLERSGQTPAGLGVDSSSLNSIPYVAPVKPAPLGSIVTTQGATLHNNVEPTSGPIGLAYPADPVNYATMQQSPSAGYLGLQSGTYGGSNTGVAGPVASGFAPAGGDNTMMYLLIAAGVAAAYFLLVK